MREQAEHATVGTKEAAKELNVLQATVSKLCREGKLPGQRKTKKEAPGEFLLRLFGGEKAKGALSKKSNNCSRKRCLLENYLRISTRKTCED